jgi:hypothetical protein
MPKATTNHGDCRLAVKKTSVVAFTDVILAISSKRPKYAEITVKTSTGVMLFLLKKSKMDIFF